MNKYRIAALNCGLIVLLVTLAQHRIGDYSGFYILLATTLLVVLSIKAKYVTYLIIILLCIPIFQTRHDTLHASLKQLNQFIGSEVTVIGEVVEDAVYGYKRQVEFFVNNIELGGVSAAGKIKVAGYGEIEVKRGDSIHVTGKLREGFGSYQGSIYYADYQVINRNYGLIDNFRHKFNATSFSIFPEPQASLGLGFLAGFRSLLPEHLETALSVTGLTHIVAVSGYNTTIIASFIQRYLSKFGSRFQVVMLTSLSLFIFLGITGLAPSIVRACIVSGLGLAAWFYGRKFNPYILLLLSAVISAYIYPLDYWYSLGWWLSFMAFYGILIVAPSLVRRYKINNSLIKLAIETSSAQLLTLPLIIWVFGKVSVMAVITNLLVLPAIPFVMLFTFVSTTAGMLSLEIGGLLSLPASALMDYILSVIYWFSGFESALATLDISKTQMISMYAAILVITWLLYIKIQKQSIISLNE